MTLKKWMGWTAGIIDGEGTITITPRVRNDHSVKNDSYQVFVKVTNTDPRMINKLRELWGGGVGYCEQHYPNGEKYIYYWKIAARACFSFLEIITPYLVCKREQAELAIVMQKRLTNRVGHKARIITEAEKIVRNSYYRQMKDLNHYGQNNSKGILEHS